MWKNKKLNNCFELDSQIIEKTIELFNSLSQLCFIIVIVHIMLSVSPGPKVITLSQYVEQFGWKQIQVKCYSQTVSSKLGWMQLHQKT